MAVNKYKTKAGVRYQAILYVKGQRVAFKSGFKTKKDAKKWLTKEEDQWQFSGSSRTAMDFEELADLYLDEVRDRRKRNTFIYKRSTFRRVLEYFNFRLPLKEINRDILAAYVRDQKKVRGSKAANCDLREIGTLFNWAIRRGHMIANPARQIEPYAEEAYVRYVPPAEDIAAVRMAANPEERRIFDTLYYTAARLSEILNLTWEDINFDAKVIRLWTSKRRDGNREARLLGMHPELEKVLRDAWKKRDPQSPYVFTNPQNGQKYTRHTEFIRLLFKRLCKKANLRKPFTAHCIRHHVASRFADSHKATHRQIQQFLGHMNLRTTETYLHELHVDHEILNAFDEEEKETQVQGKP
ncbi:tyrosine-type recombinase/integrase [Pseudodesulfovibrio tunisiensis]|uniref:tyrosine-type recombinase/integrase n=1 Tax=Pseudodesulfovibrio tunisiensis TaxID=463192 RepID=UPI001FB1FD5E|nr:site-specific integrase [Pseudodesulfovibrio tunisiensis]